LRLDVIEDLLDYVWVNNPKAAPSDDTHGAATQRAHGNIKPIAAPSKTVDQFAVATLSPGQRCD
jgi:hypothetical protein